MLELLLHTNSTKSLVVKSRHLYDYLHPHSHPPSIVGSNGQPEWRPQTVSLCQPWRIEGYIHVIYDTQTKKKRGTEKETRRERYTEKDTHTDLHRYRDTHRNTETQRYKKRHRDMERDRDTEIQTHSGLYTYTKGDTERNYKQFLR